MKTTTTTKMTFANEAEKNNYINSLIPKFKKMGTAQLQKATNMKIDDRTLLILAAIEKKYTLIVEVTEQDAPKRIKKSQDAHQTALADEVKARCAKKGYTDQKYNETVEFLVGKGMELNNAYTFIAKTMKWKI